MSEGSFFSRSPGGCLTQALAVVPDMPTFDASLGHVYSFTISMQWADIPRFQELCRKLLSLQELESLTLQDIIHQSQCNRYLRLVTSKRLAELHLEFDCESGIEVPKAFLTTHPHIRTISLSGSEGSGEKCKPILIPSVPQINVKCFSPSFQFVSIETLEQLSISPLSEFAWNSTFCLGLRLFTECIHSLTEYTFQNVKVNLDFPTGLAYHLSQDDLTCSCAEPSINGPIIGVTHLTVRVRKITKAMLVSLAGIYVSPGWY
ncbi:hypothetical protein H1R20_g13065, partial [Candolleomyces eurysporus]